MAKTPVPMAFPLATGSYSRARSIADRLGAAAETLRMAYGEHTGMTPDKLKRVFSDAVRWQLQRILEDQAGSAAPKTDHETTNLIYATAWEFLAKNGPDARWTPDDHADLMNGGWSPEKAAAVGKTLFDNQDGRHVSRKQIDTYLKAFAITDTRDNVARIQRTVFAARAAACREATKRLTVGAEEVEGWLEDALVDEAPYAFEQVRPPRAAADAPRPAPDPTPFSPAPSEVTSPHSSGVIKKRLLDACEECVLAFEKSGDWSAETSKQTRTAVKLLD